MFSAEVETKAFFYFLFYFILYDSVLCGVTASTFFTSFMKVASCHGPAKPCVCIVTVASILQFFFIFILFKAPTRQPEAMNKRYKHNGTPRMYVDINTVISFTHTHTQS